MPTNSTDKSTDIGVVMLVQSLPPLQSGGAETQALRLSAILKDMGVNVFFISPGVRRIKGQAEINGVPVFHLHSWMNRFLDLLFYIQEKAPVQKQVIAYDDTITENNTISRTIGIGSRLRYLIFLINAWFFLKKRKADFQIIHIHTIEWPAYVGAVLSKWLNKKLLVKDSTMNGIFNILRFPSGQKKQQLIIRQAHFVAMTKVIYTNFLKAGIPPENISKIPNGIQIDEYCKTSFDGDQKVLMVGNLYQQPAKGIDILLKCWSGVLEHFPSAMLTVAGDGDLDAYRRYTRELGIEATVVFLGKYNGVPQLMVESDVFVLPSRREGMPNVLMEAMLRGLPCVATDISGSQDLIDHGRNGLLVPPRDAKALSESILYMLRDRGKAREMGIQARETILSSFDIKNVASQYVQVYNQLTENNHPQ